MPTSEIPWRPMDYGVDWITATAATKVARRRLSSLGSALILDEGKAGNEQRNWGMAGYEGLKCGGVQLGERFGSTLIRLSSGVAFDNWQKVYHAAENFSRLDLQVTARMDQEPLRIISQCYQRALRHSKKRKGSSAVSILRSSNGTATIYLGRRQSMRFARIYDKGAESKLDHYAGAVRFEVEYKGALCLPTLRAMSHSPRPLHLAASIVVDHFRDRGVTLKPLNTDQRKISVPRCRSDHARRLGWLQQQVSPSVKILIAAGHHQLVLEALGLSAGALEPAISAKGKRLRMIS